MMGSWPVTTGNHRGRSAARCDAYLMEHWTRDVRDHDTVICLGDVAMARPTDGLIGPRGATANSLVGRCEDRVRRAAEAAVSSWRSCGGVVVGTDSRPSQDAESTEAKPLRVRARGRRG